MVEFCWFDTDHDAAPLNPQPEIPASEISRVFGTSAGWSAECLIHNPRNAVTAGVWRVTVDNQTAILKILTRSNNAGAGAWSASDEPSHWNYWCREALFYRSALTGVLAEGGISAPNSIAVLERSHDEIAVWIEDVAGKRGDLWDLEDHCAAARALGRANAIAHNFVERSNTPWLSRRFLRSYSDKPVNSVLLEDDQVWDHPLVSECLGPEVRESGRLLAASHERLVRVMEQLPSTLCHLDFWPMNLIRRHTGAIVALDWAFVGEGAIGEDLGNHVPDSAFDLFVPANALPTLDQATFSAFVEGLTEAGWQGDPRLARLGVCASAVKYVWLLPLMLDRAVSGNHTAYGGANIPDPTHQYRERGRTLNFLADWVREANDLTVDA
jgi:hypothetical protein